MLALSVASGIFPPKLR